MTFQEPINIRKLLFLEFSTNLQKQHLHPEYFTTEEVLLSFLWVGKITSVVYGHLYVERKSRVVKGVSPL